MHFGHEHFRAPVSVLCPRRRAGFAVVYNGRESRQREWRENCVPWETPAPSGHCAAPGRGTPFTRIESRRLKSTHDSFPAERQSPHQGVFRRHHRRRFGVHVVYLIPGLTGVGAASGDTYAVIYPHWYSRFLSSGDTISQQTVSQMARQQMQQRSPQYADNPMMLTFFEQQVGQQLVQQQVLLAEAEKLGIRATDDDVRQYLHTGPTGEVLFPNGQFIGDDQYAALISDRLNMSVKDFEDNQERHRHPPLASADHRAPSRWATRKSATTYRKSSIKIKFDYAVISVDDLRKPINPSDSDLEAFFKKNAARYASAVPEERKITYFAFTPNQLPGGVPQPSQQEIQQYFAAHQTEYSTPEQARSRHILIKVAPGADAKTDAAAKAKAEGMLKQIKAGGNFADLAKKNSDDPGSKDTGGELGFAQRGPWCRNSTTPSSPRRSATSRS